MKYLLILLFLFSTHSFSGELDGKGLDCNLKIVEINQKAVSGEPYSRAMFWFNLNTVQEVNVGETDFTTRPKTPDEMKPDYFHLFLTENEIFWIVGYDGFKEQLTTLNRKNLFITKKSFNLNGDGSLWFVQKGKCKVFNGFETVREYILQERARIKKSKEENKI